MRELNSIIISESSDEISVRFCTTSHLILLFNHNHTVPTSESRIAEYVPVEPLPMMQTSRVTVVPTV